MEAFFMKNYSPRPEGMSWLIPYLMVKDAGKAANFYHKVFGFEILSEAKDDKGQIMHAELRYKDIVIMCGRMPGYTPPQASGQAFTAPITLYVYCEDVNAKFEQIKQSEAKIISEPEDSFWGDRTFTATDLDGNAWCFATNIAAHQ
ncbi:MAG: Glyoxalase/bleomycin resistance protein/dioxygenase [Gammaproteobacteria bacterium]|nr:Glyoxalase/bleomycin resistance protein/dioxygenase [Gammaproteobacteria bacterium]